MIITAFTIAKDLEEAERLRIKKHYGDLCKDCNTLVRYTSNNNCVACSAKRKGGKSAKIPNKFFCKQHQEYLDMSLLGERTRYYSLCKSCKESRDAKTGTSNNLLFLTSNRKFVAVQFAKKKREYQEKIINEINAAMMEVGMEFRKTPAKDIACFLNSKKILSPNKKEWTDSSIYMVLYRLDKARRAAYQKTTIN